MADTDLDMVAQSVALPAGFAMLGFNFVFAAMRQSAELQDSMRRFAMMRMERNMQTANALMEARSADAVGAVLADYQHQMMADYSNGLAEIPAQAQHIATKVQADAKEELEQASRAAQRLTSRMSQPAPKKRATEKVKATAA